MNIGKMLLAAAVGGITYFFLGWGIWGVLLSGIFELAPEVKAVIARNSMNVVAMLFSCLFWGMLLSYIFSRWAGVKTFAAGAVAGASIAALVSLTVNLGMISQYTFFGTTQLVADVAANTVATAIVGGVVGWILGRGVKA